MKAVLRIHPAHADMHKQVPVTFEHFKKYTKTF